MKIGSLPPVNPVESSASQPRSSEGQPTAEEDKVTLSKDASFVSSMREKASESPLREDVVAAVKAELANGTFERNTNLERVVDGLLADL